MSNLKAISLSYKNTPLEVRELFSFSEQGCKDLLFKLKEKFDLNEALIISTCNRTEIYYAFDLDLNDQIINYLIENTEVGAQGDIKTYFTRIPDNNEAVQYLFEVSAGLHAQVLGDFQISGQIKDAYQWSADVNMAGPYLHRLMHTIFFTNKKITQETSFRDGAASISYAATELVDDVTGSNKRSRILLIGTGEIGEDVAKNLLSFGYQHFTICNRTILKAQELAVRLSDEKTIDILPFESLFDEISDYDVIISAIQVETPLISSARIKGIRIFSHKYFIDLAVPRSIDQDIEEIPGVILYNIEDLNRKTTEAQVKRLSAIPHVRNIITESVQEFLSWSKEMEVSPTIHKIKNALETIRQEELNRYNKQFSENELKMIDAITKNIMQKIIKLPVVQLKAACKRGEQESMIELLNELFDLEKQKTVK